jgi:hypothetical protein
MGKNRPETPFVGREMRGRRWLNMRSKVLNRNGTFVGIEGVTGAVENLFAPFVLNSSVHRTADFDDFKEQSVRNAAGTETAVLRKLEWEKVMGSCETP